MTAIVKLFRWLLVLPAAIAVVPAADWVTLQLLDAFGAPSPGVFWFGGRVLGHFATGAAAILLGAWVAPARRQTMATILFVLAILGAIEAAASGELPLWLVLPLAGAFLTGAWLGLRTIRRGSGTGFGQAQGSDRP